MKIEDQPPPVANSSKPVWELVIADIKNAYDKQTKVLLSGEMGKRLADIVVADMRDRDRVGRERYGTPLQAHNGRDALVDAYQECLDAVVYLRQAHEEMDRHAAHTEPVCGAYTMAVNTMLQVRVAILCREEAMS